MSFEERLAVAAIIMLAGFELQRRLSRGGAKNLLLVILAIIAAPLVLAALGAARLMSVGVSPW